MKIKSFNELCLFNKQVEKDYIISYATVCGVDPEEVDLGCIICDAEIHAYTNQLDIPAFIEAVKTVEEAGFMGECVNLHKGDPFITIKEWDL